MLAWDIIEDELIWEGSWRDIYVLDTRLEDWQRVVDAIRGDLRPVFHVDGAEVPLPVDIAGIFALRAHSAPLLSVFANGAQLNCHFFCEEEIEFDLDPREVRGQLELDGVVRFMSVLAKVTGKPALMTPENRVDAAFLRIEPSGAVHYTSSGGFFRDMASGRVHNKT